jgi:hypothetical protein
MMDRPKIHERNTSGRNIEPSRPTATGRDGQAAKTIRAKGGNPISIKNVN